MTSGGFSNEQRAERVDACEVSRFSIVRLSTIHLSDIFRNMFAFIIGIDKYKHATNLEGAVSDADMMESFLRNNHNVTDGRIINLRNEGATQKAITDAFCTLCQSESIRRDDPILIYFAGHGCEMPQPDGWGSDAPEKIRGIYPHDVQRHELTDRTIISWLDKLSSEKGDNIARPRFKYFLRCSGLTYHSAVDNHP